MRLDKLLYDFEQQKQNDEIVIERTIIDDKEQANNPENYERVLDSEETNQHGNTRRIFELEPKTED